MGTLCDPTAQGKPLPLSKHQPSVQGQRFPRLLLSSSTSHSCQELPSSTPPPEQETVFRNPLYLVEDKSVMENLESSTAPDTSENLEQPQATLIPGLLTPGIHPWGYPGAASWLEQPSMARQDTPELEQLL